MLKHLAIPLAALFAAALLMVGCGDESEQTQSDPAESWTLPVLDADGLAALRERAVAENKVLVIDCWATWCEPCKELFPLMHAALGDREDVLLVSVSTDEDVLPDDNNIERAKAFLTAQDARGNAYVAVGGDARTAFGEATDAMWSGSMVPAVFVYAPDGSLSYASIADAIPPDRKLAEVLEKIEAAQADGGQ